MVSVLDDVIGNLTDKLDQLGLLDNTLIVFISDNGGAVYTAGLVIRYYINQNNLF